MRRRTVLASLGTLSGALAGCTNDSAPGTDTASDGTTDTTTQTDRTSTVPDSRFADAPCPSFGAEAEETVCYHRLGNTAPPVSMEPSTELFEPSPGDGSVESMSFDLHNRSGSTVGLNPYNWTIRRQTDDGWERVAPEMFPDPWFQLEDGQDYTWVLTVEEHPTPQADRTRYPMVDLADGVYSFEVTVSAAEGPNSGSHTECVVLFEVQRA
jgi:hypothetical protein